MDGDAVFEDGRKSLVIGDVQLSDAGIYVCRITTRYGNRSTTVQLDVYGKKSFDLIVSRWKDISLAYVILCICSDYFVVLFMGNERGES